jgi:hypothetical protein
MEVMGFRAILVVASVLCTFSFAGCGHDASQGKTGISHLAAGAQAPDRVTEVEHAIGAANVKTFGGSDKLPIGGPLASVTVPQSDDEKKFLADFSCLDESECYGPEHFERFALAKYPDIAKVRFRVPTDLAVEDKEEIENTKQNFRRGLYFAKEIKLANGQTLFDFLTKCSKTVSPFNWAEMTRELNTGRVYAVMQYFPVLRQDATGDEFELDIHLERKGDQIAALSPAFSSSVLRNADFMVKHGVSCWRKGL